jgi:predicted nucleic acid-binding protein
MKYFFDTSAFVKFYRDEKGTDVVEEIIQNEINQIMVMELLRLEFVSALFRKFRNNEITDYDLSFILNKF